NLVVKVTDSWLACHELEPSSVEDLRYRKGRWTSNLSMLKRRSVSVVWKLEERIASSYVNPTPLAHADTSRAVLPRGGTSQTVVP
ncbi:hypothetical protein TNCV_1265261, partial [Trichonephila clavipes]